MSTNTMTTQNWQLECAELKQRGAYLFKSKMWADCTFQLYDVAIRAHKLIMAMASPVFARMLYGEEATEPVLIYDVRPEVFNIMLENIYSDNLNLNSSRNACDLYYAAKKWQLRYLAKDCVKYLNDHMTADNVCHIYQVAYESGETPLLDACEKIFSEKTREVLQDKSFYEVSLSTVSRLIALEPLDIRSELDLFDALVRYHNYQEKRAEDMKLKTEQSEMDGDSQSQNIDTESEEIFSRGTVSDSWSSYSRDEEPDPNSEVKAELRKLVKTLRFLTLSPVEFAEGRGLSTLLKPDEMLALSMNISSSHTGVSMPEGFSTNMVPRTLISQEERSKSSIVYRATIPSFQDRNIYYYDRFYLQNMAWTVKVASRLYSIGVHFVVLCYYEGDLPDSVKNAEVQVKFCSNPMRTYKYPLKFIRQEAPALWEKSFSKLNVDVDECDSLTYQLYVNMSSNDLPSKEPPISTPEVAANVGMPANNEVNSPCGQAPSNKSINSSKPLSISDADQKSNLIRRATPIPTPLNRANVALSPSLPVKTQLTTTSTPPTSLNVSRSAKNEGNTPSGQVSAKSIHSSLHGQSGLVPSPKLVADQNNTSLRATIPIEPPLPQANVPISPSLPANTNGSKEMTTSSITNTPCNVTSSSKLVPSKTSAPPSIQLSAAITGISSENTGANRSMQQTVASTNNFPPLNQTLEVSTISGNRDVTSNYSQPSTTANSESLCDLSQLKDHVFSRSKALEEKGVYANTASRDPGINRSVGQIRSLPYSENTIASMPKSVITSQFWSLGPLTSPEDRNVLSVPVTTSQNSLTSANISMSNEIATEPAVTSSTLTNFEKSVQSCAKNRLESISAEFKTATINTNEAPTPVLTSALTRPISHSEDSTTLAFKAKSSSNEAEKLPSVPLLPVTKFETSRDEKNSAKMPHSSSNTALIVNESTSELSGGNVRSEIEISSCTTVPLCTSTVTATSAETKDALQLSTNEVHKSLIKSFASTPKTITNPDSPQFSEKEESMNVNDTAPDVPKCYQPHSLTTISLSMLGSLVLESGDLYVDLFSSRSG